MCLDRTLPSGISIIPSVAGAASFVFFLGLDSFFGGHLTLRVKRRVSLGSSSKESASFFFFLCASCVFIEKQTGSARIGINPSL